LRNWITDSPLDIRPMGVTRYDADNYCNFIMNSNKRDGVDIDNSDRRYNFGLYQENKLAITEHEVSVLLPKELPYFFN
ncbi:primase-helicase family protein, partial [Lacticaseibacillus paracasei]